MKWETYQQYLEKCKELKIEKIEELIEYLIVNNKELINIGNIKESDLK